MQSHQRQLPTFLRSNSFVLRGYRPVGQKTTENLKSVCCWSNETLNIWIHIIGFFLFFGLLFYDIFAVIPTLNLPLQDVVTFLCVLVSFLGTMFFSVMYHTMKCQSEKMFMMWLSLDLTGVTVSMTSIFASGIYFGYQCFPEWKTFYISVIGVLTVSLLTLHFQLDQHYQLKITLYVLWALFGLIPTVHWLVLRGGFQDPLVKIFIPKIGVMYLLVGVAFFFYVSNIPERCCPGRVDYVGNSHQIWHLLVVVAMLWWHETGLNFAYVQTQYNCSVSNHSLKI
ncbi:progestin and adipoQ receptor family member 3 [Tachypleus tridentatus]|uniref:progestin and adipoQ receptor family member 3 n=1 Tax=Tachypleus tridentatus TaxID=6853 RepID=UPI003FD07178